jgi:DNA polymerase-3 subunit delta
MSAEKIITDFKKKAFKPVYWLEGDEPYFIDEVINYAEHKILSESEASFNLTIFYGRDANWADVVNACRRYPMFAERQVVLLKEAQHMKDIDKLEGYIEKPLPSTVFVVGFKEKKLDGRGKMAKLVKKQEYFFSEKVKDYKLNEWVLGMIKNHGLDIANKALVLLVDSIGNDLSRLQNEVEKLVVNLAGRKNITDDDIEKYIGISKEFNAFELQDALAKKDILKAVRIIHYFEANPKAAPIQLVLPTLYNYFSKVYSIFGLPDMNERTVATLFYNNSFAAKQALQTVNNYGYQGVERILLLLHSYNLRSIGINNGSADDAGLMKELIVKMMS